MAGGQSQSQSFHFSIYGISTSTISSPLSMAMEFPLAGPSSRFVLSRWIVSSRLVCCVFLESGCRCLSLESRHVYSCLFVIENGGHLKGKWIRGLDMIPSMIFIYGRTSVFSPFVFFSFLMLCLEGTRKMKKHCMQRPLVLLISFAHFGIDLYYYVMYLLCFIDNMCRTFYV